jgi:hypothetical protein
MHMRLIDAARDTYSQNGEDGILERIFDVIGPGGRRCCEFGAWDGVHLSNARAMVVNGWSGVFIESDADRFHELLANYRDWSEVQCIQAVVNVDTNRLDVLLERHGIPQEFDLLSIDVDGLDYWIFETLPFRPRVICVEVNGGHPPTARALLPLHIAERNVGQPLGAFTNAGAELGYRLVAYTGNAFFVHCDEGHEDELPTLTPATAYEQHLARLATPERRWLYRVNYGLAPPYHRFGNAYLEAAALGLSFADVARARILGTLSLARKLKG